MAIRNRNRIALLAVIFLTVLLAGSGGAAQQPATNQPWPAIALEEVAVGLRKPVSLTHAGDGSGRLFVLEQEARFQRSADDPNRGEAAGESVLLTVEQPYPNHNGGPLLFGPDGFLYLALGDGGGAGDPGNRAQNLGTLLGKILRIDPAGTQGYRVPAANPFVGRPGRDEIWARGLRNPWRISFDRGTGDLYIADVGQERFEEVNLQTAGSRGGENYGWNIFEGNSRYRPGSLSGAVFPVAEYTHAEGGCAITGGYVYRGRTFPALTGIYLYADYCSGKIWGLRQEGDRWVSRLLLDTEARITSFGEDEQGELYVIDHGGRIYRIRPAG